MPLKPRIACSYKSKHSILESHWPAKVFAFAKKPMALTSARLTPLSSSLPLSLIFVPQGLTCHLEANIELVESLKEKLFQPLDDIDAKNN